MTIALTALLALALAAWVLSPVLAEGIWSGGGSVDEDPDELRRRRDTALHGLRDLEMDREMGKVEDLDYRRARTEYEREALDALERLEALGSRRAGE